MTRPTRSPRDVYEPDWRVRLLTMFVLGAMLVGMARGLWPVVAACTLVLVGMAVITLRRR